MLRTYSWPGNVRELKNAVYRAFILAEKTVEIAHPHLASRVKKPVTQGDAMSVWVGTPLADAQKQIILGTLKHCGGDKRRAAKALGVSLKTLYNRLSIYGGDDGRGRRNRAVSGARRSRGSFGYERVFCVLAIYFWHSPRALAVHAPLCRNGRFCILVIS